MNPVIGTGHTICQCKSRVSR